MVTVEIKENKSNVHCLIYKEVQQHGKSQDLENMFQEDGHNFLATELQSLYNNYCGIYIIFFL